MTISLICITLFACWAWWNEKKIFNQLAENHEALQKEHQRKWREWENQRVTIRNFHNVCRKHLPDMYPDSENLDACIEKLKAQQGVFAVDPHWNLRFHAMDLGQIMSPDQCRFIGSAQDCTDFIKQHKP